MVFRESCFGCSSQVFTKKQILDLWPIKSKSFICWCLLHQNNDIGLKKWNFGTWNWLYFRESMWWRVHLLLKFEILSKIQFYFLFRSTSLNNCCCFLSSNFNNHSPRGIRGIPTKEITNTSWSKSCAQISWRKITSW